MKPSLLLLTSLWFCILGSFSSRSAFAQSSWNSCAQTVAKLPIWKRAFVPADMCSRLQFIHLWPGTLTAIEKESQPVSVTQEELLSFVDTASPIPSIHFMVWLGKLKPLYASQLPFWDINSGAPGVFKSDWSYLAKELTVDILIDGVAMQSKGVSPAGHWAGNKWENLVAGTQVVPFPAFGMALISVLLTPEGRSHVESELSSGSGLQSLFQWRVVHGFESSRGRYEAVVEGGFQCLTQSDTVLSESDSKNLHPIMSLLPVNISNIRTLRRCQ